MCRHHHLLATLLLLCLQAQALWSQQSIDDIDLMGYHPGWHADSLPGTKSQGKYQKLDRAFPLESSRMNYQGIALKSVVLFFHKNKLHSIDIKLEGANGPKMLALIESIYGPGTWDDNVGVLRRWPGEKVVLFYEENMMTHEVLFSAVSIKVNEAYRQWLDWLTAPH